MIFMPKIFRQMIPYKTKGVQCTLAHKQTSMNTYNLLLLVKVSIVAKNNLHNQTNMTNSPKCAVNADSPASMDVHQTGVPLHKQGNEEMCSEQLWEHNIH